MHTKIGQYFNILRINKFFYSVILSITLQIKRTRASLGTSIEIFID